MADYTDLLTNVTGPGDAATVLIAGVAGLTVDAGLNLIGFMSPGTVGISAASGALGVKKSIEAGRAMRKTRKRTQNARRRANRAVEYLSDSDFPDGAAVLRRAMGAYDRDLIDEEKLEKAVDDALDSFSEHTLTPESDGT